LSTNYRGRNYESLVREAILAAKTDRPAYARRLLLQALRINPADARLLVWYAKMTEDPDEKREYFEKAIAADPSDEASKRSLAILTGLIDENDILDEGQGISPLLPETPYSADVQSFMCPRCGAHFRFDLHQVNLVCDFCGHTRITQEEVAADSAELSVGLTLPTARGHRWSEAQHQLACSQCGAVTILQVGERTNRCAFCGSNQLIEAVEDIELVEPQVIGLNKVDPEQAQQALITWLKDGIFTPGDLQKNADQLELRFAYYPFWTFDGTLEASWRCELREGGGNNSYWVPRNGTEFVLFDDVLVPGLRSIEMREIEAIEPFNLKKLVAYKPEYLAGWGALSYDISLADGSLLAREKVVRDLRGTIRHKIEPGREKRNVSVGGGKWSGLSYKYTLLPLYLGSYFYKNENYRVIINGQTGKVGGEKPKDRLKVTIIWIAVMVTVLVLAVIAFLLLTFIST
jgi:DNA-directed RNA polymerase subunit RPC12/RpoP